jgi:hypothetical protein
MVLSPPAVPRLVFGSGELCPQTDSFTMTYGMTVNSKLKIEDATFPGVGGIDRRLCVFKFFVLHFALHVLHFTF